MCESRGPFRRGQTVSRLLARLREAEGCNLAVNRVMFRADPERIGERRGRTLCHPGGAVALSSQCFTGHFTRRCSLDAPRCGRGQHTAANCC